MSFQSSNIHSSDVETTLWFFRPSILQLQNRDFSRLESKVSILQHTDQREDYFLTFHQSRRSCSSLDLSYSAGKCPPPTSELSCRCSLCRRLCLEGSSCSRFGESSARFQKLSDKRREISLTLRCSPSERGRSLVAVIKFSWLSQISFLQH